MMPVARRKGGGRPKGRGLLGAPAALLTGKAYSDNKTRCAAGSLNFRPVVPPKKERGAPRRFDRKARELYKQRNVVGRLFRRLKAFRRIFTRYDKLDIMFTAFVHLALICIISLT
jgi:transposase